MDDRDGGERRLERAGRIVLWAVVGGSWVVAVAYMWDALTTVPSAERLEESRLALIPTPRIFFTSAVFSAMELGIVLAALWPGWQRLYATRLAVTVLALSTWFIMTTPMDVNRMDWVHRRWLAFMIVATFAGLIVLLSYRAVRRLAH